jgi:hypothetical protein
MRFKKKKIVTANSVAATTANKTTFAGTSSDRPLRSLPKARRSGWLQSSASSETASGVRAAAATIRPRLCASSKQLLTLCHRCRCSLDKESGGMKWSKESDRQREVTRRSLGIHDGLGAQHGTSSALCWDCLREVIGDSRGKASHRNHEKSRRVTERQKDARKDTDTHRHTHTHRALGFLSERQRQRGDE